MDDAKYPAIQSGRSLKKPKNKLQPSDALDLTSVLLKSGNEMMTNAMLLLDGTEKDKMFKTATSLLNTAAKMASNINAAFSAPSANTGQEQSPNRETQNSSVTRVSGTNDDDLGSKPVFPYESWRRRNIASTPTLWEDHQESSNRQAECSPSEASFSDSKPQNQTIDNMEPENATFSVKGGEDVHNKPRSLP